MPTRSSALRPPKYCLHRGTGQAYVTLQGREHYLGKHGSPESREAYDQLVLKWRQDRDVSGQYTLTLGQLCLAFLEYAADYYRDVDGAATTELQGFRNALQPLCGLFASLPVIEFGPRKLDQVRESLIRSGRSRSTINKYIGRIKRLLKWGVSRELVPAQVLTAVGALEGLQPGRSRARETEPVQPVPDAHIAAVLPLLTTPVATLVRLQLLTGMRPSEALHIRLADIDRSGRVWIYSPPRHKTAYRQKRRVVCLGPKAQLLLKPYLDYPPEQYLFRPEDGRGEFVERAYQSGSAVRVRGRTGVANRPYSLHGYTASIRRACETAGVAVWTPGRLRHNAATAIRREFGDIDAARCVLGHSDTTVTQIYAERDLQRAAQVMLRIG